MKTKYPNYQSGLYGIDGSAAGVGTLTVFCDMETDGGIFVIIIAVIFIFIDERSDETLYIQNLYDSSSTYLLSHCSIVFAIKLQFTHCLLIYYVENSFFLPFLSSVPIVERGFTS